MTRSENAADMGYPARTGQAWRRVRAAAILAAAAMLAALPVRAEPACSVAEDNGNRYAVCVVDLTRSELRLFWRNEAGSPFQTFRAVAEAVALEGQRLSFAMNAGMYHADYSPVGLYLQAGTQHVAANTNEGPGNFHLLPNGVFYWAGQTAGVMETNRFLAERPAADYATQSGPLLLIDGEVHPRFIRDSDSRRIRNGVGIIDAHRVAFVISDNAVSFYDFALFFRDRLGVRDALYLDGSISSIYAPQLGRMGGGRFGPIVGVVER
jgi:uncharacterized protein YigE (DUF2233 family)